MNHRKNTILAGVAVACLAGGAATAIGGTVNTTNEALQAHILGLPKGYAQINMATCKFAVKEVDVRPSPSEAYARAEDIRHDALDNCLRHRVNSFKVKAPAPDADGVTGYVRVTATINFKQTSATASCPSGDVVLGGGASVEVEGSYPSSDAAWTVTRDNTWGHLKTGTVYATCATQAAS